MAFASCDTAYVQVASRKAGVVSRKDLLQIHAPKVAQKCPCLRRSGFAQAGSAVGLRNPVRGGSRNPEEWA